MRKSHIMKDIFSAGEMGLLSRYLLDKVLAVDVEQFHGEYRVMRAGPAGWSEQSTYQGGKFYGVIDFSVSFFQINVKKLLIYYH